MYSDIDTWGQDLSYLDLDRGMRHNLPYLSVKACAYILHPSKISVSEKEIKSREHVI